MSTKGLNKVVKNLNTEIDAIKGRSIKGLLRAGLMVQARSQKRVPVEYGKLRSSAYTRKSQASANTVEIGYSAAYALFVHENMEAKWKGQPRKSGIGVYWGPHGEPKFLERPLYESKPEIINIIKADADIK